MAASGVAGSSGECAASARVSLTQQTERLTDAYLAAVLPLEEYQRRRLELEQRQSGIAEQARQLEGSRGRHDELAGMVPSMEAFCQRVELGLASATFEQKRHLIELLIDRVIVTNEEVEIRYVIPTSTSSEHVRFCHVRLDYFDRPAIPIPVYTTRCAPALLRAWECVATCTAPLDAMWVSIRPSGVGHRHNLHKVEVRVNDPHLNN